jgi:hypothetical protein
VDEFEPALLFEKREQLLRSVTRSAASLVNAQYERPAIVAAPARSPTQISPVCPVPLPASSRVTPRIRVFVCALAVFVTLTLSGFFWFESASPFESRDQPLSSGELDQIVERIIAVESNGGDPLSRRSSAAGPAQFLAGTWLELVRAYRPDLMKDRSPSELLSMRCDPKLARYMTKRLLQRHAAVLRRRGLPVTPSTLYLGHFAGGAGAVAALTASKSADAALVLAHADATGKMTRERIVAANPFLDHYTVGDLEDWADRKIIVRTKNSWLAGILSSPVAQALGEL